MKCCTESERVYVNQEIVLPDLPTPSFPRTTARMVFSVWWWTLPLPRRFPIIKRTTNKCGEKRFLSYKQIKLLLKYERNTLESVYICRPAGTPSIVIRKGVMLPRGLADKTIVFRNDIIKLACGHILISNGPTIPNYWVPCTVGK